MHPAAFFLQKLEKMENKNIKYNISTDYEKLYHLLKSGHEVIGFIAIEFKGKSNPDYSKVVQMSYNDTMRSFNLGFTIFESDFDKVSFRQFCEGSNLRFIPF